MVNFVSLRGLTNHGVNFVSLRGLTNHGINFLSLRGLTNHGIDATDRLRTIYVRAYHALMASSLKAFVIDKRLFTDLSLHSGGMFPLTMLTRLYSF